MKLAISHYLNYRGVKWPLSIVCDVAMGPALANYIAKDL